MKTARYDQLGIGYAAKRKPDPRIAELIRSAIGIAKSILNVGAGAGSYEPVRKSLVALEPSREMLAQHPPGLLVRGVAEELPFADGTFEVGLASLTVHHWKEVEKGLAELLRVSQRQVIFGFDPRPEVVGRLWLTDYLPQITSFELDKCISIERLVQALGPETEVRTVPIPADCHDGFQAAYWARPEAYLDPQVRRSISTFHFLDEIDVKNAMRQLESDLATGIWHKRYGQLLEKSEHDFGYRLLVSK